MKINDLNLLSENYRLDDTLRDLWSSEYTPAVDEEIESLISVLDSEYNHPKVQKAKNFFTRTLLQPYSGARIPREESKGLKRIIDNVFLAHRRNEFENLMKSLNKYKRAIEELDKDKLVFSDYTEIEDREYDRESIDYDRRPKDPYAEHGVSRKDFY